MTERYIYINATSNRVPTNGAGGSSTTLTASELLYLTNATTTGTFRVTTKVLQATGIGKPDSTGRLPTHVHAISGTGVTAGLYPITQILDDDRVELSAATISTGGADLLTGDITARAHAFKPVRLLGVHVLSAAATNLTLRNHIGTALVGGTIAIGASQIGTFPLGFLDGQQLGTGFSCSTGDAGMTFKLFYDIGEQASVV